MLVRHAEPERGIHPDQTDATAHQTHQTQPRHQRRRRIVAAPRRGDAACLLGRRDVIPQPDIQDRLDQRLTRSDEIGMVEIQVVGEPEDVGLVVAIHS